MATNMKEHLEKLLDDLNRARKGLKTDMDLAKIRRDEDKYWMIFDRWMKVCELIGKYSTDKEEP